MPSTMCTMYGQAIGDQRLRPRRPRKVTMRCAQSARTSMTLPSACDSENGSVIRPSASCTHRMIRIAMSVRWLVRRMRGSKMRR